HLPVFDFFVAHFSGIAIGTMVMFTGIGGGVLWIPILTFLEIKPSEAVAISIFTQIAGKGVGSINYLRAGMVDLKVAAVFVPAAFVGALIGYVSGFMISARHEKLLLYIFVIVATYLLVKMILSLSEDQSESHAIHDAKTMGKSYPVVLFSSFFTGLLSIGNSDWLIPYMQRKLKLSTSHSVATGLFVMFMTAVFFLLMTVVSVCFGLQSWPDGAPVLFATCSGVMMGGQIGTRLVRYQWLKDRQKHAFILLLAMSIIHLLW
ncbi:MAG: sulfite exporter TauE/SafE family protein, partial [Proteobacteria bacterium]|nr:sulfite exporter TauE/SafE family protein [Pseudomonadota bacterium]